MTKNTVIWAAAAGIRCQQAEHDPLFALVPPCNGSFSVSNARVIPSFWGGGRGGVRIIKQRHEAVVGSAQRQKPPTCYQSGLWACVAQTMSIGPKGGETRTTESSPATLRFSLKQSSASNTSRLPHMSIVDSSARSPADIDPSLTRHCRRRFVSAQASRFGSIVA